MRHCANRQCPNPNPQPLENFQWANKLLGARKHRCRVCHNEHMRERRHQALALARQGTNEDASRATTAHVGPAPARQVRVGGILAVGDIHFPFHSKPWLSWIQDIADRLQPTHVIQVGDLYDMYSYSKYPRSLNVYSPEEEMALARQYAEQFWAYHVAAGRECWQLLGNHDERMMKRVLEALPAFEGPALEHFRGIYTFDGVSLVAPDEELEVDGVLYQHGYKLFGRHAPHNRQNTVAGHTHKGGTQFHQERDGVFWELGVGCGIDVNAPVFGYKAQKLINGTHLGVGYVDELGPSFFPYRD